MEELEDGLLGELFRVADNDACPISEYIIFPYPASTLTDDEYNVNFIFLLSRYILNGLLVCSLHAGDSFVTV